LKHLNILLQKGYGIDSKDWIGALQLDCRIGEFVNEEKKKFYKSQFFSHLVNSKESDVWGRMDSNGSKDSKFNIRTASFTPEKTWKPEFRVTIATVSTDYLKELDESRKLHEMVYLRIEDELVSIRDANSKLTPDLRNTVFPQRTRIIIDILEESLKQILIVA
jgi:hypothetical protein